MPPRHGGALPCFPRRRRGHALCWMAAGRVALGGALLLLCSHQRRPPTPSPPAAPCNAALPPHHPRSSSPLPLTLGRSMDEGGGA